MYLHIGTDVLLREKDVIAIIGRKGEKDKSRINRRFLKQKENEGKINNISNNNFRHVKSHQVDGRACSPAPIHHDGLSFFLLNNDKSLSFPIILYHFQ